MDDRKLVGGGDPPDGKGEEPLLEGIRRPTPARVAMEPPEEGRGEGEGARRLQDPGGEAVWVVRVSGRTAAGILPLRTVPLLELTFTSPDHPAHPPLRTLCSREGLEGIEDEELLALLRLARGIEARPPPTSRRERKAAGR